jgi:hypothetical protein
MFDLRAPERSVNWRGQCIERAGACVVDDVEHSLFFRDRPHKLRYVLRRGDFPLREPVGEVSELLLLFFPQPLGSISPPMTGLRARLQRIFSMASASR